MPRPLSKASLPVGMGEALWDVLPEGKKIGGAPANFAYHVSQFGFDSRATVRELLYHIHFRLSTLFSKFLKSFLKSLSLLFKSFLYILQIGNLRVISLQSQLQIYII